MNDEKLLCAPRMNEKIPTSLGGERTERRANRLAWKIHWGKFKVEMLRIRVVHIRDTSDKRKLSKDVPEWQIDDTTSWRFSHYEMNFCFDCQWNSTRFNLSSPKRFNQIKFNVSISYHLRNTATAKCEKSSRNSNRSGLSRRAVQECVTFDWNFGMKNLIKIFHSRNELRDWTSEIWWEKFSLHLAWNFWSLQLILCGPEKLNKWFHVDIPARHRRECVDCRFLSYGIFSRVFITRFKVFLKIHRDWTFYL